MEDGDVASRGRGSRFLPRELASATTLASADLLALPLRLGVPHPATIPMGSLLLLSRHTFAPLMFLTARGSSTHSRILYFALPYPIRSRCTFLAKDTSTGRLPPALLGALSACPTRGFSRTSFNRKHVGSCDLQRMTCDEERPGGVFHHYAGTLDTKQKRTIYTMYTIG